jgi:PPK2 family polyphosphate:nucleotide phosphotransferase
MMGINVEEFRIHEGASVDLALRPTRVAPVYESKKHYKGLLKEHVQRLSKFQRRLYAADTYSLLLIFQALDAAGKDGAIRHVMSGVNPQGCQVYSFKHPSAEELDHDFLWRTNACLPERGRIGIFNRSYYEEVLIVRVHPDILEGQRLPDHLENAPSIWESRFRSIRELERHLSHNGTRIIKFFLHLSKEEQRKRFIARVEDPDKNWKFSINDVEERKHWEAYMHAYAECLAATSTNESPWYAIPADDKRNTRLFVSQAIVNTIEALDVHVPALTEERKAELQAMLAQLTS